MNDKDCCTPNELPAQKATLSAAPQNVSNHTSPEDWKPLGDKPMSGANLQ